MLSSLAPHVTQHNSKHVYQSMDRIVLQCYCLQYYTEAMEMQKACTHTHARKLRRKFACVCSILCAVVLSQSRLLLHIAAAAAS